MDDGNWEYAVYTQLNQLNRLFWMNPYQKVLRKFFGDVIILDTCHGKNLYDYALTTFIMIDEDNESCNIGYYLHLYEDEEMFTWMFCAMRNILRTSFPESIFLDHAPAIECGIRSIWPDAYHGVCLWHLQKNLTENLARCLRNAFLTFMQDF